MELATFLLGISMALAVGLWLFFRTRMELSKIRGDLDHVEEEKNMVLDFIRQLNDEIGADPENAGLYKHIVRATALSCNSMSACIYERMPDGRLKVRAVEGLFPPQRPVSETGADKAASRAEFILRVLETQELEANEGLIGAVANSRKGMLIKDAKRDPRVIRHSDESLRITSMIIVPVVHGDSLYGVLALANPMNGRAFDETNYSVAASLAGYAALALKNSETMSELLEKSKMDYDLKLASGVQSYLLPSALPQIDGISSASRYKPHRQIGGDFYDFFRLPDSRWGMVVADVSGKGISAAIITAICQTKFSYIAKKCLSPAETLKVLNAEIFSLMRRDMFVTMVYAVMDADLSKITLARAGHERPVFYDASEKRVCEIKGSGAAVGLMDSEIFDTSIEEQTFDFAKGDILLLYTDGISEAVNADGEEFSSKRILSALENLHTQDCEGILEGLTGELRAFTGGKLMYADDLSLLAVKRKK